MREPTKEQIAKRAASLMALPELEYQRILTAAESIEYWNLAFREEKAENASLRARVAALEQAANDFIEGGYDPKFEFELRRVLALPSAARKP